MIVTVKLLIPMPKLSTQCFRYFRLELINDTSISLQDCCIVLSRRLQLILQLPRTFDRVIMNMCFGITQSKRGHCDYFIYGGDIRLLLLLQCLETYNERTDLSDIRLTNLSYSSKPMQCTRRMNSFVLNVQMKLGLVFVSNVNNIGNLCKI